MTDYEKIVLAVVVWVLAITGFHLTYNFNWRDIKNARLPPDQRKLNVAFIPVT